MQNDAFLIICTTYMGLMDRYVGYMRVDMCQEKQKDRESKGNDARTTAGDCILESRDVKTI